MSIFRHRRGVLPRLQQSIYWNCLILLIGILWIGFPNTVHAASCSGPNLSGTVFRDYNADGIWDHTAPGIEPGVSAITVTVYTEGGSSLSCMTDANGSYSMTVAANEYPMRLEFSGLPSYLEPGAFGADSVASVTTVSTDTADLNFGVNNPAQYCQSNPTMAVGCYVFGEMSSSNTLSDTLVTFAYDAGSKTFPFNDAAVDSPAPNHEATHQQIGATYGLAYQRESDTLFASAFAKRHSDYGPDGPAAIYRVQDISQSSLPTISLFIDLNALFPSNLITDSHPITTDGETWRHDDSSYLAAGTTSFGDMDISEDEETLYVINLFDRQLYEIPIANPISTTIGRFPLDTSAGNLTSLPGLAGTCPDPATDIRPFGLGVQDGLLYLGLVCSAESTGNDSDLQGYIYSFDPTTDTFTQLFAFPFDYDRDQDWKSWVTTNADAGSVEPQPMISDIVFDNEDLIIGIRDRYGDQTGHNTYVISSTIDTMNGRGFGDILRACANGSGGWDMEVNGSCGGITTDGQNNGEGFQDGGGTSGEYYWRDDNPASAHNDVAIGGLAQIPGLPQIAMTIIDPIYDSGEIRDGGIAWLDNRGVDAGERTQAYRLYDSPSITTPPLFGKANGLGDLEALCTAAPIEIGNYVWLDSDKDGLQDPTESPLPNIAVTLHDITGTLIATTTTSSQGQYYFISADDPRLNSSYSVTVPSHVAVVPTTTAVGGLVQSTTYAIRIDMSQSAVSSYTLTSANVITTSTTITDGIDSDAITVGNFSVITLTTGSAGQNNHHFDIGLTPIPFIFTMTHVTPSSCDPATKICEISATISWTTTIMERVIQVATNVGGRETITIPVGAANAQTITVTGLQPISTGAVQVLATDGTDAITTTITTQCPSCTLNILYICGTNKPQDADRFDHDIIDYLRAFGHNITPGQPDAGDGLINPEDASQNLTAGTSTVASDIDAYDFVIISQSAAVDMRDYVGGVRNALTGTTADILTLQPFGTNTWGMQTGGHTYFPQEGRMYIADNTSPILPDGLSNTSVITLYNDIALTGLDGFPKIIATNDGVGTNAAIGAYDPTVIAGMDGVGYYGYDKGATMASGSMAPAKRYMLGFMHEGASAYSKVSFINGSANQFFTWEGLSILHKALEVASTCASDAYTIGKTLNTAEPVRTTESITFTIAITNTGTTTITSLPLTDTYQSAYLQFITATVAPDDLTDDGQLNWSNVLASAGQSIAPSMTLSIIVEFLGIGDTSALANNSTINMATVYTQVVTDSVQIINPTAVNIAQQSVEINGAEVTLRWTTVNETDMVGFHLHRQLSGEAEQSQLTSELIVAQKAGQSQGAVYEFIDQVGNVREQIRYILEILTSDGTRSSSVLGETNREGAIFLPLIQR